MGYFSDGFRALGTTMKNLFRRPTTVHYPAEKRERAERYRNSFALLHEDNGDEACVGCLQCERICPSYVITVIAEKKDSPFSGKRRGYAKDFTLDLNACIFCELCVQVCPTDAIVMLRVPEKPSYSRENLVLTMDKLYENEKRPLTWGTASKLMEMQDPKRGQPNAKAAKAVAAESEAATAGDAKPAGEGKPPGEKKAAVKPKATAPAEDA
jgi:NADH-quinone oxidoreductase subunit I